MLVKILAIHLKKGFIANINGYCQEIRIQNGKLKAVDTNWRKIYADNYCFIRSNKT